VFPRAEKKEKSYGEGCRKAREGGERRETYVNHCWIGGSWRREGKKVGGVNRGKEGRGGTTEEIWKWNQSIYMVK